MHWCFGRQCTRCENFWKCVGRILLTGLIATSAFTFLFGIGISATEMISVHDSRQNARLDVLDSRIIALDKSVTEIKGDLAKRTEAKEERNLVIIGALVTSVGTFGASVVTAIFARRTYRKVNGQVRPE